MKKVFLLLMVVLLLILLILAGNSFADDLALNRKEAEISKFSLTSEIGIGFGTRCLTTKRNHNLLWSSVDLGWIFTDTLFKDHWYQGNLEGIAELFGGLQFSPNSRYFSGGSLLFRYNIDTKSKWIPFINAGAGLTLTNISCPDISKEPTQFNVQVGMGLKYKVRKNLAIVTELRWLHICSANIHDPNRGVNTPIIMTGLSWTF